MTCEVWREGLSALVDGEDPGVDRQLLEAHVARCEACRIHRERLHALRRHGAVRPAAPMPDLSRRVVELDRTADRASRWLVVRGLLVAVAVEIIVLSLPALILGEEHGSSAHAARHLGAFTIAYGVALLVVAVRPARARTLLPVAGILAAALAVTAVIDVIDGQVPLSSEAVHVPELASVALIWLLAIPVPRRSASEAAGSLPRRAILRLGRRHTAGGADAGGADGRRRAL